MSTIFYKHKEHTKGKENEIRKYIKIKRKKMVSYIYFCLTLTLLERVEFKTSLYLQICHLTFWEKPQALFWLCNFCAYYIRTPAAKAIQYVVFSVCLNFSSFLAELMQAGFTECFTRLCRKKKCIYDCDLRFLELIFYFALPIESFYHASWK